jgi:hypothetical protein
MLKPNIELVRDGERKVLLTWHKPDGEGGHIPVAIEYADDVDQETRDVIERIVGRPINVREHGKLSKAFPKSSKHFNALSRVLARQGFRTRQF